MKVGRKRVLVTLAVAAVIVAWIVLDLATVSQRARAVLDSQWFPLVLIGLYLVRPFLGWPITALSALVGFKYGIVLGVPIALLGAIVSTSIPFAATRYFEFDAGLLGWATEESQQFFETAGGLRGTIAARVAPVPAEATSLAAGTADVRPSAYLLGTAVGEIPWAVAAVTIGHSMYRLTLSDLSFDPWLLAATLLAAIVIVAGPAYRLVRGTEDDTTHGARDSPANE